MGQSFVSVQPFSAAITLLVATNPHPQTLSACPAEVHSPKLKDISGCHCVS